LTDTDDVSWLQALQESRRPDPGPVVGRWALGIGDMVADHSLTPDKLRGLARKLNHFGGVAISKESVEFDGDDVKWSDVTEIRTRSLIEYLFTGGIDKQADKLPLPWFPGRGMLISAISRAALTLLLAAAKQELEGTPLEIRIPAEVHYRGMLRTRELSPGHARRSHIGRSGGSSVFRGDRAGAKHHDLSRRGRRDGGRRRESRAGQVDAGDRSGPNRPPQIVISAR
jgi:hypothetical protein